MNVRTLLARAGGEAFKAVFAAMHPFRPDRPIHCHGVILEGTLTHARAFSGEEWLDTTGEEPVLARISRSVGLPDSMPDVVGLALRIGDADVLLASTGHGPAGRFLLRLRRSVVDGPFTSLMPFKGTAGAVLLAARREGPGPAIRTLSELRTCGQELRWGLYYSRLRGPWTRFASLRLVVSDDQSQAMRFDPVGRPPMGLATYAWSRALRDPSYGIAQESAHGYTSERTPLSPESDPWKPITRFPRRIRSPKT